MKEPKRQTVSELMTEIDKITQKDSSLTYGAANIDYGGNIGYGDDTDVSNYKFDLCADLRFGGNEGVYLEINMHGNWNENQNPENSTGRYATYPSVKRIGLYKTLGEDYEAMRSMGALGGAIVYHGTKYINNNLDRYTPKTELEHFSQYPIVTEPKADKPQTVRLEQSKENPDRYYAMDNISKCCIVQKIKDGKSGYGDKWGYDYEQRQKNAYSAQKEGIKPELPVFVKAQKLHEVINELKELGIKVECKLVRKPSITETLATCSKKADEHNASLPKREEKIKQYKHHFDQQ